MEGVHKLQSLYEVLTCSQGNLEANGTYIVRLLQFIIMITSSDDIQPSTVVSDQLLCKSLCGH